MRAAIGRVLDSRRFVLGPEVEAFEAELAGFCGVKHAVGLSSGTDALLASLMVLGVRPGDRVRTTAFSFIATAEVIARLGAIPEFADIEADSFNLDPRAMEPGAPVAALLPVHLFGRPARWGADPGVPVLEDAAQAIGVPLRGLAATLSFYPTKNLGAAGDGGAVLTDDPAFADALRLLRQHGDRPRYVSAVLGGNFRLDALQAAVLRAKLPYLRGWITRRQEAAARYRALFQAAAIPGLGLPAPADGHVWNQFVVRAPRRDALRARLSADGIGTEVYYPRPLPAQPCFAHLGHTRGEFPVAEQAAGEVLALPMGPYLRQAQQERVVERFAAFYASGA